MVLLHASAGSFDGIEHGCVLHDGLRLRWAGWCRQCHKATASGGGRCEFVGIGHVHPPPGAAGRVRVSAERIKNMQLGV